MINPNSFREAIRTTTATYPVPFAIGLFLLFALLCFCGSLAADGGALRWVLTGTGLISALIALVSWTYALFFKPNLLRSERHMLLTRYFDALEDNEMDPETRTRVSSAILGTAEELIPKRLAGGQSNVNRNARRKDGNG